MNFGGFWGSRWVSLRDRKKGEVEAKSKGIEDNEREIVLVQKWRQGGAVITRRELYNPFTRLS